MKKRGLKDSTVSFTRKALFFLSKHSDVDNPESVKGFIATLNREYNYNFHVCR